MADQMARGRVLLTGAAGALGRQLRRLLAGRYPVLRLSDVIAIDDVGAGEEVAPADLADFDAVARAVAGCDAIIHFGACSVERGWPIVLNANIIGAYNLFEAARQQGARRIVFASSNHAVGFYRRDQRIGPEALHRPDGRYGLSKAFGEDLGRLYADKHGLEVLALRIGTCRERPVDVRGLSTWQSFRDLAQLVTVGLEAPTLHFAVAYGVSANTRAWWDNGAAEALGYRPQDNAEIYAAEIEAAHGRQGGIGELTMGGGFVQMEFDGDVERTLGS